jgi:hypothetical protein
MLRCSPRMKFFYKAHVRKEEEEDKEDKEKKRGGR